MAHVESEEMAYKVLVGALLERDHLEGQKGRYYKKWILKKCEGNASAGLIWLRVTTGGRLLWICSINYAKFLDELFTSNLEINGIGTRFNSDLHVPSTTLTLFQKGVFFSGCRIFNHHPTLKDLFNNGKRFRSVLKKHLLENCFYLRRMLHDNSFLNAL